MQLIHYSKEPLKRVRSMPHCDYVGSPYKTAGLWLSVGDDWLRWCKGENFKLNDCRHATEVILSDKAKVLHLRNADDIDNFTISYGERDNPIPIRGIKWDKVRAEYQGIIIAPYCWSRRLAPHTHWYYGWDCASGVVWDKAAVKELRALPAPNLV